MCLPAPVDHIVCACACERAHIADVQERTDTEVAAAGSATLGVRHPAAAKCAITDSAVLQHYAATGYEPSLGRRVILQRDDATAYKSAARQWPDGCPQSGATLSHTSCPAPALCPGRQEIAGALIRAVAPVEHSGRRIERLEILPIVAVAPHHEELAGELMTRRDAKHSGADRADGVRIRRIPIQPLATVAAVRPLHPPSAMRKAVRSPSFVV